MSKKTTNRIWIELEKPLNAEHGNKIASLANNMLRRLGDGKLPESTFWWDARDRCYCYGGDAGYVTLSENGTWFNLDYLGREA